LGRWPGKRCAEKERDGEGGPETASHRPFFLAWNQVDGHY
jgi:hypothetical protein